MYKQCFTGPAAQGSREGHHCCCFYLLNKMILDWYFVYFNLGEDQKKLWKFCSYPLNTKQSSDQKQARPRSNESWFPEPPTWLWHQASPVSLWALSVLPVHWWSTTTQYLHSVLQLENSEHVMLTANQHQRQQRITSAIVYIGICRGLEMWLTHGYEEKRNTRFLKVDR